MPLYYTGLSGNAVAAINGENPTAIDLDRAETATIAVKIPAPQTNLGVVHGTDRLSNSTQRKAEACRLDPKRTHAAPKTKQKRVNILIDI